MRFYFLNTLAYLLRIIYLMLFARAILSWFPLRGNLRSINAFLYSVTEPMLQPIRNFMIKRNWLSNMPFDFSIIILILLLQAAYWLLVNLLFLL